MGRVAGTGRVAGPVADVARVADPTTAESWSGWVAGVTAGAGCDEEATRPVPVAGAREAAATVGAGTVRMEFPAVTSRPAWLIAAQARADAAATTRTHSASSGNACRERVIGPTCRTVRDMAIILIVEDDPAIRGALTRSLTNLGHAVTSVSTGMAGLQRVIDEPPDVVVLDLGLPDIDGRQVLPMLRAVSQVPVIVATANDEERTIIQALDAGADDYLVKPFGSEQLEARIRAVLRRLTGSDGVGPITIGGLAINPAAREVVLDGRVLELSRKEFDLLHLLAQRVGEVVSKRDILAEVWRQAYGGSDRTVDVHVSWLRRKLGETAAAPVYLHSVRGVGVRLADPTGAASADPGPRQT